MIIKLCGVSVLAKKLRLDSESGFQRDPDVTILEVYPFDCGKCDCLTNVSNRISEFPGLEELNIFWSENGVENCTIPDIAQQCPEIPKLRTVRLINVPDKKSPFICNQQLTNLSIYVGKDLTDISGLSVMKNLMDLKIQKCEKIGKLPGGIFKNNTNLLTLNLYNNNITSVHKDSLNGLINLKEIILSENPIEVIPSGKVSFLLTFLISEPEDILNVITYLYYLRIFFALLMT